MLVHPYFIDFTAKMLQDLQNSLSLATTRSLECENYQVQICDFLDTYRQGLSRTSFTLHDFDGREQRAFRDMPPNK